MKNQYRITFVHKGKPTAYNDLPLKKAIKLSERFDNAGIGYRAWRFNLHSNDFEQVTIEDLRFISDSSKL